MRLTPQQIEDLLKDGDFGRLPGELGLLRPYKHWSEIGKNVSKEGARAFAWMVCHKIAELFDAYPDTIHEFKLRYKEDSDLLLPRFIINQTNVYQERHGNTVIPLSRKLSECLAVDEGKAVDAITDWIDGVGRRDNGYLIGAHVWHMNVWFQNPITSAQQARLLAVSIAPEVEAWAKKHLLESALNQEETNNRPVRRSGPARM